MSVNMFEQALAAEGVSGPLADIARSVYQQESGSGTNTKKSNADATGGMQIIPSTFASVADKGWDINDPMQNARAGIRYLAQLNARAGGDPALTAVGYYGGPGAMDKAKQGVAVRDPRNPRAPDTLQYAQQVVGRIPKSGTIVPKSGTPVETPVAEEVPVQLAQSVPVEPGYVAPKEEWKQFQQATAEPVNVAALNFGGAGKNFNPLAYAPASTNVDFRAFGSRRGRV